MENRKIRLRMIGLAVLAFAVSAEPDPSQWFTGNGIVESAEARVGRPHTPVSVAGEARRSTRQNVRRMGSYVTELPADCVTEMINGQTYYHCGPTYYESDGSRYQVVIISN